MKILKIYQGYEVLLDDADYDIQSKWKWHLNSSGYAKRIKCDNKSRKIVLLHREIMSCPSHLQIDHINKNPLDNRKINLRICTASQNNMARGKRKNAKVPYKGVSYKSQSKSRFGAKIRVDGKLYHLGYYNTAEEAALAYDKNARKFFGEFAYTNFDQHGNSAGLDIIKEE